MSRPKVLEPAPEQAGQALKSYLGTYDRRARKSSTGVAFESAEQNALLALLYWRHARSVHSSAQLEKLREAIEATTRHVLAQSEQHQTAVDLTGFVLSESYGLLPMARPAIEQLEWVLASGLGSGKVGGAAGSGWRTLFLASAMPSFSWEHRPTARAELDRRLPYFAGKLEAIAADQAATGSVSISQLSRLAFLGSALLRFVPDPQLETATGELVGAAAASQRDDGSFPAPDGAGNAATAVVAQFVVAAQEAGRSEAANRALDHLIRDRLDRDRHLFRVNTDSERYELSPWPGLALSGVVPDAHPRPEPRSLRSIVARLRRGE